jgi:signal transduction histidine kinase
MREFLNHYARLLSSTPFRLTLAYMGAFVVAAVLIVGFIAWRANALLTNEVVETLQAEVTGLREQFQAGGAERLAAVIAQRAGEPGSGLYLLVDATGRKVAGNLERAPPEFAGARGGSVFSYVRTAPERRGTASRLAVGVPLPVPGGLMLIVGRDIEDLHRFAGTMGQLGLWSIVLLSILGVGAGLAVSRSVLRRIETITDASRTIMAGDLSKRIPLDGSGDELDRLSESLNGMLTRIEELIVALREVSDNIAHDLKTPLNRLRNRAEAALAHPDGAASYRDGLVKTIEEADELIKTFNSLLLIARLEAGAVAESMGPVDPASIVGDVAELYEPVAEEAGLELQTSVAKGLSLVVNRELVSQAVANLVDNAIKYSIDDSRPRPADGAKGPKITLSMDSVGDTIEIAVADRGPGVAPQDRERALQRFVRLEKSRSRPGSGLGLSLVAAVARLHGGSVRLEDNAPGLRAVLTLPIRTAARHEAGARAAATVVPAGARRLA